MAADIKATAVKAKIAQFESGGSPTGPASPLTSPVTTVAVKKLDRTLLVNAQQVFPEALPTRVSVTSPSVGAGSGEALPGSTRSRSKTLDTRELERISASISSPSADATKSTERSAEHKEDSEEAPAEMSREVAMRVQRAMTGSVVSIESNATPADRVWAYYTVAKRNFMDGQAQGKIGEKVKADIAYDNVLALSQAVKALIVSMRSRGEDKEPVYAQFAHIHDKKSIDQMAAGLQLYSLSAAAALRPSDSVSETPAAPAQPTRRKSLKDLFSSQTPSTTAQPTRRKSLKDLFSGWTST